jgi:hypothetical protein
MPTDPYVAVPLVAAPRHRQNQPAGIAVPPPRPWHADRPGDLRAGQPHGALLGRPGPNVGYAMSLARRSSASWKLAPTEDVTDALAVVAEIAMKRAARYGRGPTVTDVERAVALLGYDGSADASWPAKRSHMVHGADHHYEHRRALVDLVPDEVLAANDSQFPAGAAAWRLQAALADD